MSLIKPIQPKQLGYSDRFINNSNKPITFPINEKEVDISSVGIVVLSLDLKNKTCSALLQKRGLGDAHGAGKWAWPGGHHDDHTQDFMSALIREFNEEATFKQVKGVLFNKDILKRYALYSYEVNDKGKGY